MTLRYNIGDGADALFWNQHIDALSDTYWVNGWTPSTGTNAMEVDLASGSGVINGSDINTGSTQTVTISGNNSGNPRKDVIYFDSNATAQVKAGTAKAAEPSGEIRENTYTPAPPALATTDGVVVASVWVADGTTDITSGDIRDRRMPNQGAGGGVSSVQSTEPAYTEGSTWLDTDTGVLRVAYPGPNGNEYYPVQAVNVTHEAATFTESNVTVSFLSNPEALYIDSGSVKFRHTGGIDDFEDNDATDWPSFVVADNTHDGKMYGSYHAKDVIDDFQEGDGPTVNIAPDYTVSRHYVANKILDGDAQQLKYKNGNGNDILILEILDTSEWSVRGAATTKTSISTDTLYEFHCDWDWANNRFKWSFDAGSTFSSYIDFDNTSSEIDKLRVENNNVNSGNTGSPHMTWYFDWIRQAGDPFTSASASVHWSSIPADLSSWDLATYQETENNGSITFDAVDGANNVLQSDIIQGADISTVSTSTDVGVKANFSWSSGGLPQWDYAARRGIR